MANFSIHGAQANLCGLITDTLAGAEVVIIRDGFPAVRLVPVPPRGKRRFGALKGKVAIDTRFNEPLAATEPRG